jgi:hypothetical protein
LQESESGDSQAPRMPASDETPRLRRARAHAVVEFTEPNGACRGAALASNDGQGYFAGDPEGEERARQRALRLR